LTKVVLFITGLQMLTVVTTNNMKIIVAESLEVSGTGSSIQSYTVPKLTPTSGSIRSNATALSDGNIAIIFIY